MTKRSMFDELMTGVADLASEREAKITLRKSVVERRPPARLTAKEVVAIREKLNMSQPVFAHAVHANVRTYERYEREGVKGSQAALIKLVGDHPELLAELQAM